MNTCTGNLNILKVLCFGTAFVFALLAAPPLGCDGDQGTVEVDLAEPSDTRAADRVSPPDTASEDTPPDTAQDTPPDTPDPCGDGECIAGDGEDCMTCQEDCGECSNVCGNCICQPGLPIENPQVCPEDCGSCGDGVCACSELEDDHYCGKDCATACGDGICDWDEGEEICPIDCGPCGDGVCGYQDLLNPDLADCTYLDCGSTCGDDTCDNNESPMLCPVDCGAPCGDGLCEAGEWPEGCAVDCGSCGDGVCGKIGSEFEPCPLDCVTPCGDAICTGDETPDGCPVDCGSCGDGVCGWAELETQCCGLDCPSSCGDGGCGDGETELSCPADCACKPVCAEGWTCGDDAAGCGEVCGACADGDVCVGHICCTPSCEGKECGDDGCGGDCGVCSGEQEVCLENACICVPDCLEKDCGDDGCGGICDICSGAQDLCVEGLCVCQPDCDGKGCGADGCDGTCGACDDDEPCTEDACEPDGLCSYLPVVDESDCAADGICSGACFAGLCIEVAVEVCNGMDDDCDGDDDEDFLVDGAYATLQHCGACDVDCAAIVTHATSTCDVGGGLPECLVESCNPGYWQDSPTSCIVPPVVTCAECVEDEDCYLGDCVDLDGSLVCLDPCNDGDCGIGSECETEGDLQDLCVPVTGDCSCTPANAGAVQACAVDNEFGVCPGTEICDGTEGWINCDAQIPAAETCDGLDNDCNDTVDDGFPNFDNDDDADCVDDDDDDDGVADGDDCATLDPAIPSCEGLSCGTDGCTPDACGVCTEFANAFCDQGNCACTPDTCVDLAKECGGGYDDGCGGTASDCGTCEAFPNSFCAAGTCDCTAETCGALGKECDGGYDDGCGGTIADCGSCDSFQNSFCDGGTCGCTADTCGVLGKDCGSGYDDGCGSTVDCGICDAYQNSFCDGGTCGCTASTCGDLGKECDGGYDDGCGGTVSDCGTCDAFPNSFCAAGTCDCTAETCGALGKECDGGYDDGCGGTIADCGSCDAFPNSYCAAGTCDCTPDTCGDLGHECGGGYDDGCEGTLADCGTCGDCGDTCEAGLCVFTACDGAECGDDGCGGTCGENDGGCSGANDSCIAGLCVCQPDCGGKVCGDDGCGGACPPNDCPDVEPFFAGEGFCDAGTCSFSCIGGYVAGDPGPPPACDPCGAVDQPCCDGGACGADLVCTNGTCACGGPNQPCCGGAGGTCDGATECLEGICACGDTTQDCCPGDACLGGQLCDAGVCFCAVACEGESWMQVLTSQGAVWAKNSGGYIPVTTLDGGILTGLVQISTGNKHACGVTGDGAAWCWPREAAFNNDAGELGTGEVGSPPPAHVAVQVTVEGGAHLTGATAIDLHKWGYTACVVKDAGEIWCWGMTEGTMFDDPTGDEYAPYAVPVLAEAEGASFSGAEDVALGGSGFICARKSDNTVWCWGDGADGVLGQGDQVSHPFYPVQVTALGTSAVQIDAGSNRVCAVMDDSSVKCWGSLRNSWVASGTGLADFVTPMTILASESGPAFTGVDRLRVGYPFVWFVMDDADLWHISVNNTGWSVATSPEQLGTTPITDLWGVGVIGEYPCYIKTDGTAFKGAYAGDGEQIEPPCPVCTPDCGSVDCGDDGCGGSCGTCGAGTQCAAGLCVDDGCTPSCGDGVCGADGCGGWCPTCPDGAPCIDGACGALPYILDLEDHYYLSAGGLVWTQQSPFQPIRLGDGNPLSGATALAIGSDSGCALMGDGEVMCWSEGTSNSYGQLGNGSTEANPGGAYAAAPVLTAVETPLTGATSISGWGDRYCAVAGEKAYCWGRNENAVLFGGDPGVTYSHFAIVIQTYPGGSDITGVTSVAVGAAHLCMHRDGEPEEVACWGPNNYGELGLGIYDSQSSPAAVSISDVAQIEAGLSFTCARMDDGTLKCWGDNNHGQMANGSGDGKFLFPMTINMGVLGSPLDGVADVVVGADYVFVHRVDGTLWYWGGANGSSPILVPTLLLNDGAAVDGVWAIGAIDDHPAYILEDGSVFEADYDAPDVEVEVPVLECIPDCTDKDCGDDGCGGSCGTCPGGTPDCFSGACYPSPCTPECAPGTCGADGCGGWCGCAVGEVCLAEGTCGEMPCTQGCGYRYFMAQGGVLWTWRDSFFQPVVKADGAPFGAVRDWAGGNAYACAVDGDGDPWCWSIGTGSFNFGELGVGEDGTAAMDLYIASPVLVEDGETLPELTRISGWGQAMCAVGVDSTLWCWGRNSDKSGYDFGLLFPEVDGCWGTFGNGGCASKAVQVEASPGIPLVGVEDVAVGSHHICVKKFGGTAWCWGDGDLGAHGLGSDGDVAYATQLTVLGTDVAQIEAGDEMTCARLGSGEVRCWGDNWYGQIGTGLAGNWGVYSPSAVKVQPMGSDLDEVTDIAVGIRRSYARRADGTLWYWGESAVTYSEFVTASPVEMDGTSVDNVWQIGADHYSGSSADSVCFVTGAGDAFEGNMNSGGPAARAVPCLECIPDCVGKVCGSDGCGGSCGDCDGGDGCFAGICKPLPCVQECDGKACGPDGCGGRCGSCPDDGPCSPDGTCAPMPCVVGCDKNYLLSGTGRMWNRDWSFNEVIHPQPDGSPVDGAIQMALTPSLGCALRDGAGAVCWSSGGGYQHYGQLGDGNTGYPSGLMEITSVLEEGGAELTGATDIDTQMETTCAVASDDTLWCWGRSWNGLLFEGNDDAYASPAVQITVSDGGPPLTDVDGVAVGLDHICARKMDGTLWCWGDNATGELGLGDDEDRSYPTEVTGLGGIVIQVVAEANYTCALLLDGTVRCWGNNQRGIRGNGMPGAVFDTFSPGVVLGQPQGEPFDDVTRIAAGEIRVYAVRRDGSLWYWGAEAHGDQALVPAPLEDDQGPVTDVWRFGPFVNSTNFTDSCYIQSDGTVKAGKQGLAHETLVPPECE